MFYTENARIPKKLPAHLVKVGKFTFLQGRKYSLKNGNFYLTATSGWATVEEIPFKSQGSDVDLYNADSFWRIRGTEAIMTGTSFAPFYDDRTIPE